MTKFFKAKEQSHVGRQTQCLAYVNVIVVWTGQVLTLKKTRVTNNLM